MSGGGDGNKIKIVVWRIFLTKTKRCIADIHNHVYIHTTCIEVCFQIVCGVYLKAPEMYLNKVSSGGKDRGHWVRCQHVSRKQEDTVDTIFASSVYRINNK